MTRSGQPRAAERVGVSLTPAERDALRELAARSQEPVARAAARLIRAGLEQTGAAVDAAPARRGGNGRDRVAESAPAWLPPSRCALAISALRDRYPHELRHAPTDVERDRFVAEQLAALSVWRDQLDAGIHDDPRMELALGAELRSLSRWLEERARRRR